MTRYQRWGAALGAVLVTGGLFLFSPKLGGAALIVAALGLLAVFAFRLL